MSGKVMAALILAEESQDGTKQHPNIKEVGNTSNTLQ